MVVYEKRDYAVRVASSLNDEVDLNAGPERQRGYRDRRAGGKRLVEMLRIDRIHRDEVADVREIHAGAHDIVEAPAGRLENCCEVPKDTLGLGRNPSFDDLAGGGILTDLTAEVEETTGFDRLREGADRWRQFGGEDCVLAHDSLR